MIRCNKELERSRGLLGMHDKVLGNSARIKRHLTNDPSCFNCEAKEESTLHIIRDCPLAKVVWERLGGLTDDPDFLLQSLRDWIVYNMGHKETEEGYPIWGTLFGVTVWWVWRWRNCYVIGRGHEVPLDLGGFIHVRYNEMRRSIEMDLESSTQTRRKGKAEEIGIAWRYPP